LKDKKKSLVNKFHEIGIVVHGFTVKDDDLLYAEKNPISEYDYLLNYERLDGIFTDNPHTAI